jgi:L-amino acid N-acyltransferase YncA
LTTDNTASLKIWDQLGFSRVGLIPDAGRLKTGPGGEEEYVDAVVVWKSFV